MSKNFCILPVIVIFLFVTLSIKGQNWVKKYTSPNCSISAEAILSSGENCYIIYNALDTNTLTYEGAVLAKIDANGNPMWAKKITSSVPIGASYSFIKTKDGHLVFLLNGGSSLMKVDTMGNFLWGRDVPLPHGTVYDLEESERGNLILVGYNDHNTGIWHGFSLTLDLMGNVLHYNDFVSPYSWNAQLYLKDIIKTSDGGCIAIGWINKNYPACDVFFVKFDSLGNLSWTKMMGNGGIQAGISIAEVSDGYFYSGWNNGNLLLGKVNKQCNPIWSKSFDPFRPGWPQIRVLNDQLEIVTLTDTAFTMTPKFVILKTDTLGNFLTSSILPDLYVTLWGRFARASYGTDNNRIILNQESGNGFKLTKSVNSGLPNCQALLKQSEMSEVFLNTAFVSCTYPGPYPIDSFSAVSSPFILEAEKACNCEPTHLTHEIKGCKDEMLSLSASNGSSHIWNTGQTDSTINVNQTNLYWVQNTSSCTLTDTFNISYAQPKAEFTIDKNEFVITEPVQLTNISLNAAGYEWDFDDGNTSNQLNPTHNWTIPGDYKITLKASDGACSDIYNLNLMIKGIVVPNVFTPNNDGTNDTFILTSEGVKELNCRILDRWGNKIYEFSDAKGWNGEGASEGTYFYIISALIDKQAPLVLKGAFTLLR